MAEFKGYQLKINGVELPGQYIQDYSSTPNQVTGQRLISRISPVNCTERFCRIRRSKIEFKTPPMSLEEKIVFQSFFPNRKTTPKITVEYWNDEDNAYTTGQFYTPDITYQPYSCGNSICYKAVPGCTD